MKVFTFEIKVKTVNGLGVSGEHEVFVVAKDMEEALVMFNTEFRDDKVDIITVGQSTCKVIVK